MGQELDPSITSHSVRVPITYPRLQYRRPAIFLSLALDELDCRGISNLVSIAHTHSDKPTLLTISLDWSAVTNQAEIHLMSTSGPPEAETALRQQPPEYSEQAAKEENYQLDREVPPEWKNPKAAVRLFQCPRCSHLLQNPVTLPCGNVLCKACVPKPQSERLDISWPGGADRRESFSCPCCPLQHTLAGCWPDMLCNNVVCTVTDQVDQWNISGRQIYVANLFMKVRGPQHIRLPSAIFQAIGDGMSEDEEDGSEAISELESSLRREMKCGICFMLLLDPWTAPCGHTFCRHCIQRVLEYGGPTPTCPACRRDVCVSRLDNRLSSANGFLVRLTKYFWAEDVALRRETICDESPYAPVSNDDIAMAVPMFVCTTSFPGMPTFLHVFEPRYREMIRRVNTPERKMFGMVSCGPTCNDEDTPISMIGTHLRIENATIFEDGRSLVETRGVSRFRVKRQQFHREGYLLGEVEDFDDIKLHEEEDQEAEEVRQGNSRREDGTLNPKDPMPEDLNFLSTVELMNYAYSIMDDLCGDSPRWLNNRILAIYGQCPNDPAVFPWWLGSIFPVDEASKSHLLAQDSVRARMKVCCRWIMDWRGNNRRR